MFSDAVFSGRYRAAVRLALTWSMIMAAFSALLLDGGQAARLTAIGLVVFWTCVVMIICRRHTNPTRFDLFFVGWGSWMVVFGFQVTMHVVWHLRGLE